MVQMRIAGVVSGLLWLLIMCWLVVVGASLLTLRDADSARQIAEVILLENATQADTARLLVWSGLAALSGAIIAGFFAAIDFRITRYVVLTETLRYNVVAAILVGVIAATTLISLQAGGEWLNRLTAIGSDAQEQSATAPPAATVDLCINQERFCLLRAWYTLPVYNLAMGMLAAMCIAAAIIAVSSISALNAGVNTRQAADLWESLLPIEQGQCMSCGALERCELCRRGFTLAAEITAAPRLKSGDRFTLTLTLRGDNPSQLYRPWVALDLPAEVRHIPQKRANDPWETVDPAGDDALRHAPDADVELHLRTLTRAGLDLPLTLEVVRTPRLALRVNVERSIRIAADDLDRSKEFEPTPLVRVKNVRLSGRTWLNRIAPAVVVALSVIALFGMDVGITGTARAQLGCGVGCVEIFFDRNIAVEYHTRGYAFMNPLLEITLTSTTAVRAGLSPDLTLVSDSADAYCDLIVVSLATQQSDQPGGKMVYQLIESIELQANQPTTVFAHAFCSHINFANSGGIGIAANKQIPPPDVTFRFGPGEGEGSVITDDDISTVMREFDSASSNFAAVIANARAGTCFSADINTPNPAVLAPTEAIEGENQCVRRLLEQEGVLPLTTPTPQAPVLEVPITFQSLATQIAVFMSVEFAGDVQTLAGEQSTRLRDDQVRLWGEYVHLLKHNTFLRDYAAIYCLLGIQPSKITAALDLDADPLQQPARIAQSPYTYTPIDASQGDISAYRLQVARISGDAERPAVGEMVYESEVRSSSPVFDPIDLSVPGDYAVCYEVEGSLFVGSARGEVRRRASSFAAYRVHIDPPSSVAESERIEPGRIIGAQRIPLPLASVLPFLPDSLSPSEFLLAALGLLSGVIITWGLLKPRASARPSRRSPRRTRVVSLLLMIVALVAVALVLVSRIVTF